MSDDCQEFTEMDKTNLINLMIEKDKRIQDLERLVEDQKRLRLQDSNQVEEKAAKIKEWVTNKLKELENQNKQLRDQNKRQKEAVETLSNKLALLSPVSSPRKRNHVNVNHEDVSSVSVIDTIDVDKSLKSRKPQLKKSHTTSSCDNNYINHPSAGSPFKPNNDRVSQLQDNPNSSYNNSTGKSIISIGGSSNTRVSKNHNSNNISNNNNYLEDNRYQLAREESPLYDSVNFEHINYAETNKNKTTPIRTPRGSDASELPPPPLPPHQSNKWELQLYDLADQTLSTIKQKSSQAQQNTAQFELLQDRFAGVRISDASVSRKSSTSSKNDLISLVNPTFTTIDGDQVVEDFNFGSQVEDSGTASLDGMGNGMTNRLLATVSDHTSQSSLRLNSISRPKMTHDSIDSYDSNQDTSLTQNLFDSPMRTKAGKDNILRTQSVRKQLASEKLYDFISADLVKRGYLIKTGALKNHNRWFVLKNFQLFSFKKESDETNKSQPLTSLKLEPTCHVHSVSQTSESSYPFKMFYQDKTIQLIAESSQCRDEWLRILSVAINMSDVDPDSLTKQNSTYEGIVSITRHGHSKRCHAVLVNHVVFFLKSSIDPTPMSYLSIKEAKIREITDSHDNDSEDLAKRRDSKLQDCSLAIYPKFSIDLDPIYMSFGCQQDMDAWLYFLSLASGVDQSFGTPFEQALSTTMINNSMVSNKKNMVDHNLMNDSSNGCQWREYPVMLYSDKPISQPLTSLPNETLQMEAIELFKSALLFTQVPLEPIAIDYHVCLLQNCLDRFLKHPELRNEFYAQLIKQCTYVIHRCPSPKLSSSSSGCSSLNPRSSLNSLSPTSSECQFVTDVQMLNSLPSNDKGSRFDATLSQLNSSKDKRDSLSECTNPPSQSELIQVMQVIAVAVSLKLPRGRIRWWLIDHLRKFANPNTNIGKYALYNLRAIDRTVANGSRYFVPSRMEIMSILLRNPYDHSKPHSLPVSFSDGSYLVVETDGSTTVEEFMTTMGRSLNIRNSALSDFYLFSDDPSGSSELHILEPQRKVLDVVGWWEQTFKHNNSGRNQNTKVIKLTCKKRLLLRSEADETDQERLLIVHQVNQEIVMQRMPLNDTLAIQLATLMAQLTYGNLDDSNDRKTLEQKLDENISSFLPSNFSSQESPEIRNELRHQIANSWINLSGKSGQDCIRVYLNCVRRLKLSA